MVVIKNWLVENGRLVGDIYGHERFEDGASVVTSPIVAKSNGAVVTFSGTQYILGEPAFMKRLPEVQG